MNNQTKEFTQLPMLQKAGVFTLVTIGILALSAVWFMYKGFSQTNIKTFAVQGKGEVSVVATKATINSDFVGEAKTSEEAIKILSESSTKVFAALADAGVKKEDIKTASVSTNPKYDYCYNYTKVTMPGYCTTNPNDPKIVGYTASQNFEIKINDNKDLVEKLLGLLPTIGARNMNGPNWEVDNKVAVQQAREAAVNEARAKAEGIAKSLGMSLGDVTYYTENQGGGGYPIMYAKTMSARAEMAPMAAMDVSVPVSQGTDKVTVNVDITYELR
jgi:uncharacterized protein YggE